MYKEKIKRECGYMVDDLRRLSHTALDILKIGLE